MKELQANELNSVSGEVAPLVVWGGYAVASYASGFVVGYATEKYRQFRAE